MSIQESNKVTLYIATHNKTGLKYFGKTTRYFTQEDLQKYYHGSGVYWNNHLKKHGDDVTIEIYGIYNLDENSEDYVKPIALKFSKDNNIAEDYNTWANIKPENGLDGGFILSDSRQREIHSGKISIIDTIENKVKYVSVEEYYNSKHYKNHSHGFTNIIVDNKNCRIKIEDYNNNNYTHVNSNKTAAIDKQGNKVYISCDEYRKGEYTHCMNNKVNALNKTTNTICRVSKEEFNNNVNLVSPLKGRVMSKESIIKKKKTMNKKSKKYNLYNHKGVLIEENVLALDIRNLSASLEKATIDNPLGSTIKSKILLNKACKLNLVGFFVEQKTE